MKNAQAYAGMFLAFGSIGFAIAERDWSEVMGWATVAILWVASTIKKDPTP